MVFFYFILLINLFHTKFSRFTRDLKVDYFQNPGSTDNTTKCERNLLQNASGFLLQNATVLLENATIITHYDDFITKCDSYYKTRRLLQTATAHP